MVATSQHLSAVVRRVHLSFIAFITLACATTLPAAEGQPQPPTNPLVFTQPVQSFTPAFGAAQVEAIYAFTNTGSAPVTILSTSTSCGCTTASLSKAVFQPGESGAITATFVVGDRSGSERKLVHVKTDARERPDLDLTLLVELPAPPHITPIVSYWATGAALTTKAVAVTVPTAARYHIVAATTQSRHFTVEATISPDGRRVDLLITPKQSSRVVGMAVDVQVVSDDTAASRIFHAFACIADQIPASASPLPDPPPVPSP